MTITPSHRIYAFGAIMFAALLACARIPSGVGSRPYLIALAIAGVAYLLAIREFLSTPRFPRRIIVIGLALAALWHLPFLLMPAGADDDVHRYVWDGRLQRLGYNPYVVVPNDPAFSALHTDETRNLNNPEVASPYPAGAQLFFRAVTAIHESAFAFKVAFVLCELAIVPLLLAELRRLGQPEHWLLAYAWNPLLVTCVTYSGHVDILGVLLLLLSVAALGRRWRTIAAIGFGLAVAVKFLPTCVGAALLASCAGARRVAGGGRCWSAIRAVSARWFRPDGIHQRIRAAVSVQRSCVRRDRANREAAGRGWSGRDGWVGNCGSAAKTARWKLAANICVADGCVASVCAGGVSLVPSVAASVRAIGVDGAAHRLDHQHSANFLRMALAHAWRPVDSSWLDCAAGIRNGGSGRRYSQVSAAQAIDERGCLSLREHDHRGVLYNAAAVKQGVISRRSDFHEECVPRSDHRSSGFRDAGLFIKFLGAGASANCRTDGEDLWYRFVGAD